MGKRGAALLLAFLVTASAAGGTVAGKVILVRDGKELPDASNAVVWIEGVHRTGGAPASNSPKSDTGGEPVAGTMKSASKRFQPRVVAVPKNTTVEFPNADPIYHNVFSVSGANRFDLGLYRSGATKPKTFSEAGLVRVYRSDTGAPHGDPVAPGIPGALPSPRGAATPFGPNRLLMPTIDGTMVVVFVP